MGDATTALRARLVFPVSGPPLVDGVVRWQGARIVEVGRDAGGPIEDLGDAAILPGLVNAHTHLEFSSLRAPLGVAGLPLADWIGELLSYRREAAPSSAEAIRAGCEQSLALGTTAVGEIATTDWRGAVPSEPIPTTLMFYEAIGPTVSRAQAALAAAAAFLAASVRPGVRPGLSPHAPYTVHPHLLSGLIELSRQHRVPVAMHLAETREELELLHLGSGPLRELLEAVDAWDGSEGARLGTIVDYLAELARAPRALVIHGNYLESDEVEFLAAHQQTVSLVYCPRTHAYFGHQAYPLAELLAAGVALALGTDSRASNPDLSLFEEMRYAAAHHPRVDPAAVLRLATLGGARALGFESARGTLEPGKQADLAVVALDAASAGAEPHERLLSPRAHVARTYLGGTAIGPAA